MAIELISKIKPKNNGNFKLVDVQDVEYNGKGLDEAIASGEFKGDKGDRGEIGPIGPTGPTGPKGDDGNDGYSPTVSVAEDQDGVTVTVQNKDGEQTAKVKNGKDYEHSEEFSALAEQVRADKESVEQSKTSVEQTVAQAEGKIDTAGAIAVQDVQNEGTTQTEKVTVEGTKQITEIQSKGEEILHSFPQDFPTQMDTKLDKQQGTEHVGKVIAVNEEGNATPLCPNGVRYNPETNNLEYGSDDLPLMEGIKLDDSLTKEGFAADAKVVGDRFDDKLNKQQGVENVGKAVVVGEDGNLIVGDVQTSGGTNGCADAIVNTASGESPLVVTDSADRTIKDLKLFGKTEQMQTTGAQLFDAKNAEFNKWVDSTGVIATVGRNCMFRLNVKPNTVYQVNILSASCTFAFSQFSKENVFLKQTVFSKGVKSFKCTIAENVDYAYFLIGDTVDNIKEIINDVMLYEGEEYKNYEPFTGGKPSPSPEYPQEIANVGQLNKDTGKYEVYVKFTGKNLFDIEKTSEKTNWKLHNSFSGYYNFPIFVGKGATVTISIPKKIPTGQGMFLSVCLTDSGDRAGWLAHNTTSSLNNTSLTYKAITDYIYLNAHIDTISVFKEKFGKLQVEYGNVATPYQPFKEQTLTLTSDRPITKLDKLVEQDGRIGWLYSSKKYTVTGSENFQCLSEIYHMGSSTNAFYVIKDATGSEGIMKDLSFVRGVWNYTDKEGFCVNTNQLHIRLYNNRIGVSDDATKEEKTIAHKAFLAKKYNDGDPFELHYKTMNPEFIPLPQSEQNAIRALSTYYPSTVITTDGGELDPDVEVSYVADTKNYINELMSKINNSLVNTQAQLL